jgi:hypothetical protein
MTMYDQPQLSLQELLFIQKSIKKIDRPASWKEVRRITAPSFLLLLITEGHGTLYIEDMHYSLRKGDCFLLTPGILTKMSNTTPIPLSYYELAFERCAPLRNEASFGIDTHFPFQGKLTSQPTLLVMDYMKMIEEGQLTCGIQQLRNHIRFQELLLLFEQASLSSQQQNSLLAVEKSIEDLHRNYHENITIEQLAAKDSIGIYFVHHSWSLDGAIALDWQLDGNCGLLANGGSQLDFVK